MTTSIQILGENGEVVADIEEDETPALTTAAATATRPLSQRVADRLRAEWPGAKNLGDGTFIIHPPVRDGGSTDYFIRLAVRIIDEEATQ